MTQLWYHFCQTHKSYAHKNRARFEMLKLLDLWQTFIHSSSSSLPKREDLSGGKVIQIIETSNFIWENRHKWEGTVRPEVYSFINEYFRMSGSTGCSGSYQSIKEMTGMYALLICPLFQFSFKWTESWLLPRTVFETLELEELHSKVSIC